MRMSPRDDAPSAGPSLLRGLAGATLALTLAAAGLTAQQREVISKEIAVSSAEATLRLEFADDGGLEISFRDGTIRVGGDERGTYERGGPLEVAWRSLLGDAVALDDGPLARTLVAWSPPASLEGSSLELARTLDETLEDALEPPAATPPQEPAEPGETVLPETAVLRSLLGRMDRIRGLAEALEGTGAEDVEHLFIDRAVVVEADEELTGSVVVVDGELDLHGRIDGDVVVVEGSIRVREGSRITGEVRVVNARVYRDGGVVDGGVRSVTVPAEWEEMKIPDPEEIRREIRDELRSELRREIQSASRGDGGFFQPFWQIGHALGDIIKNLFTIGILALLGMALIHFAGPNFDVVTDAARRAPLRAGMVGTAGAFLVIPVWILGGIALLISIVGWPVLLAWAPLFPVAAGFAALAGYLAVARNVGEWVAEQRFPWLDDRIRASNRVHAVVAGVAALMTAFVLANVASIGRPWLGFLEGLFIAVGTVATVLAFVVGFGAVLLTRGGRLRLYTGGRPLDGDDELGWGPGPGPVDPDLDTGGPFPGGDEARARTAGEEDDHA